MTPKQAASHFGLTTGTIGHYLAELGRLGLITVHGATHIRSYSKVMPEPEPKPIEVHQAPGVLQVDRHRRALYAELAAARAAIPSIG